MDQKEFESQLNQSIVEYFYQRDWGIVDSMVAMEFKQRTGVDVKVEVEQLNGMNLVTAYDMSGQPIGRYKFDRVVLTPVSALTVGHAISNEEK